MAHVGNADTALKDNPIVRRELTRDIQRALYRAGCRSVVVSGTWDRRTVKASAQFVANRNAVLPASRPDVVLLGLLRSYKGHSCGASSAATTAALTPAASALLAHDRGAFERGREQEQAGGRHVAPGSVERRRKVARRALRRRAQQQKIRRNSWRQKVYGYSLD